MIIFVTRATNLRLEDNHVYINDPTPEDPDNYREIEETDINEATAAWQLYSGMGLDIVPKNTQKAMKYGLIAAKNGNMMAIAHVASCYGHGIGCNRDMKQYWYWMRRYILKLPFYMAQCLIHDLVTWYKFRKYRQQL